MKGCINMKNKPFTLLELMVVMGIIFVVIGITVPAMLPMVKGAALRGKARNIKALLMHARDIAITKRKWVVITFTFDEPGDMNGDGYPGVQNLDDDQDGFIDEDIRDPYFTSVDRDAYDYWYTTNRYLYERGYVTDASKIYTYDTPDGGSRMNHFRKNNEEMGTPLDYNATESSSNDDEDLYIDEGDEIYLEEVGRASYYAESGAGNPYHVFHNESIKTVGQNAAIPTNFQHSRSYNEKLSEMVLSEKLFLGEHVLLTRLWVHTALGSNRIMALCRESIKSNTDPSSGPHKVRLGDNVINERDVGEYVFSGIAYGPDGQLYYRPDNEDTPSCSDCMIGLNGLIIEVTDTAGTARRLITATPQGAIKITR